MRRRGVQLQNIAIKCTNQPMDTKGKKQKARKTQTLDGGFAPWQCDYYAQRPALVERGLFIYHIESFSAVRCLTFLSDGGNLQEGSATGMIHPTLCCTTPNTKASIASNHAMTCGEQSLIKLLQDPLLNSPLTTKLILNILILNINLAFIVRF